MMNTFMTGLTNATNFGYTENGGIKRNSTNSALLDMFAMGAAMRKRPDQDVILMFRNAFEEDPVYALKCLFYIRDVRGGQGERRFFRVIMRDLATYNTDAAGRNLAYVAEYGRWDDLLVFIGTPLQDRALAIIKTQLELDVQCKTPSLLAKWMPSENTSSAATRKNATIVRKYLGMTHKQYRKTLSILRARINVLERLMSENRWDEIEFDKIPSRAGMIYKNAFARHDLERAQNKDVQTYADFAKDTTTKVNAKALYPYECVAEAVKAAGCSWSYNAKTDETNRLMVNKYWDNLADYFNGASLNALAVVDTSGSMTGSAASAPINVAISLGLYCAEKANGPFAGHYISFASRPQLIKTEGIDFVDKVARIYRTNLVDNTNLEATFDLLLNTALSNKCPQSDLPESIIVISDMQIDAARGMGWGYRSDYSSSVQTMMEQMRTKWAQYGYKLPKLIYWNVDARDNTILDASPDVSYVSGMSPSIFTAIMSGKTQKALMYEVLDSERYAVIK